MARLPTVGGDYGNWGTILNEYLQTAHNADGTLKLDVQTIADLKAVDVATLTNKQQALVAGYATSGDGGGGVFYYDAAASTADNGGTVFAPTAGSGRWLRNYSGAVNVKWFGAKGDGSTDDSPAFAAAILTGARVFVPSGTYAASDLQVPTSGIIDIYGEGEGSVLFGTNRSGTHFIKTRGSASCVFKLRNLKFRQYKFPVYEGEQYSHTVTQLTVANCWFDDCQYAIHLRCLVADVSIRENTFTNMVATAAQLAASPKEHVGCIWLGYGWNNASETAVNNGNWLVENNLAERVYSEVTSGEGETHFLLALTGFDVICRHNTILDLQNTHTEGAEGIYFKDVTRGIIESNYLYNAGHGTADGNITLKGYCNDVQVVSNKLYGTFAQTSGPDLRQRALLLRGNNIVVADNHFYGFNGAYVIRASNDVAASANLTFKNNVFYAPGAESIYRIDATGGGILMDGDKVAGQCHGYSPTAIYAMLRPTAAGAAYWISNVDYQPTSLGGSVINQNFVNGDTASGAIASLEIHRCRVGLSTSATNTRTLTTINGTNAVAEILKTGNVLSNYASIHTGTATITADTEKSNSWN